MERTLQRSSLEAVKAGQVEIEHDFLAVNGEDELCNVLRFQNDCHAPWGAKLFDFLQCVAERRGKKVRSKI